jgi:hypothetical protein
MALFTGPAHIVTMPSVIASTACGLHRDVPFD